MPSRRGRRGQSIVELALILPVLLVLVAAAIDLGRIFFARITVANSAREGAYEASYGGSYLANTTCGASNSVMCAILNEAQNSLTIAPADVSLTCVVGTCAAGAYGDVVKVTVTGHFDLLTPLLSMFFGGTNVTFSSTAIADIVDTPEPQPGPTVAPTITPIPTVSPIPTITPIPTIPGPTPTASAPTCPAPVANFSWTQQNKNAPVVFSGTAAGSASSPLSGSCAIAFWRWEYGSPDFGIDSGGALTSVSHQFALQARNYTVTLTVTNPYGTAFVTKIVCTKNGPPCTP
ncbi:MAG: PKD domain-containing protein [Actinomycetota bacterium]|nr:PKD domain-containing protein [Actinomycetota bacterium]